MQGVSVGSFAVTPPYEPENGGTLPLGPATLVFNNSQVKAHSGNAVRGVEVIAEGDGKLTITGTSVADVSASIDGSAIMLAADFATSPDQPDPRRLSPGDFDIAIGTGSQIIGGWSDGAAPFQPDNAAAGINLATSGKVSLLNEGSVSAMSDNAIVTMGNELHTTPMDTFSITNRGSLTGYLDLYGATNGITLENSGTWIVRNFADTDGDGVRDSWSVAVSNFGLGGNAVNNAGTLVLAANTAAAGSAVEGQILEVATFNNNAGVIDLVDGAQVAGDVLVVSGGDTAGSDGGGVFVANGGTLRLNTVLNEGDASSQSDVLVVDSTQLGAASTVIAIHKVGSGLGAQTNGHGILLVEVLNQGASADGVFRLASPLYDNGYVYTLVKQGDGNWYLVSQKGLPPSSSQPIPLLPLPLLLGLAGAVGLLGRRWLAQRA